MAEILLTTIEWCLSVEGQGKGSLNGGPQMKEGVKRTIETGDHVPVSRLQGYRTAIAGP